MAYNNGSDHVTVWRYGVTDLSVFNLLRDTPPKRPVVPVSSVYVVQAGDTLGAIAETHGVSVDAIMQANGLSDPNYIYVGQELVIPGSGGSASVTSTASAVSASSESSGQSGGIYTVVSGDTLYGIATQFDTTVDVLVSLNGIDDPAYIYVGQEIRLP
jgi:lysozyme